MCRIAKAENITAIKYSFSLPVSPVNGLLVQTILYVVNIDILL